MKREGEKILIVTMTASANHTMYVLQILLPIDIK
jgi:hypothetical protein